MFNLRNISIKCDIFGEWERRSKNGGIPQGLFRQDPITYNFSITFEVFITHYDLSSIPKSTERLKDYPKSYS